QVLAQAGEEIARVEELAFALELEPAPLVDFVEPPVGLAVRVPELAQIALVEDPEANGIPKDDARKREGLTLDVEDKGLAIVMKRAHDFVRVAGGRRKNAAARRFHRRGPGVARLRAMIRVVDTRMPMKWRFSERTGQSVASL